MHNRLNHQSVTTDAAPSSWDHQSGWGCSSLIILCPQPTFSLVIITSSWTWCKKFDWILCCCFPLCLSLSQVGSCPVCHHCAGSPICKRRRTRARGPLSHPTVPVQTGETRRPRWQSIMHSVTAQWCWLEPCFCIRNTIACDSDAADSYTFEGRI